MKTSLTENPLSGLRRKAQAAYKDIKSKKADFDRKLLARRDIVSDRKKERGSVKSKVAGAVKRYFTGKSMYDDMDAVEIMKHALRLKKGNEKEAHKYVKSAIDRLEKEDAANHSKAISSLKKAAVALVQAIRKGSEKTDSGKREYKKAGTTYAHKVKLAHNIDVSPEEKKAHSKQIDKEVKLSKKNKDEEDQYITDEEQDPEEKETAKAKIRDEVVKDKKALKNLLQKHLDGKSSEKEKKQLAKLAKKYGIDRQIAILSKKYKSSNSSPLNSKKQPEGKIIPFPKKENPDKSKLKSKALPDKKLSSKKVPSGSKKKNKKSNPSQKSKPREIIDKKLNRILASSQDDKEVSSMSNKELSSEKTSLERRLLNADLSAEKKNQTISRLAALRKELKKRQEEEKKKRHEIQQKVDPNKRAEFERLKKEHPDVSEEDLIDEMAKRDDEETQLLGKVKNTLLSRTGF